MMLQLDLIQRENHKVSYFFNFIILILTLILANLGEKAKLEREKALEAVKQRREQGKSQRHRTYMKQRNRRPRVHEELVEERKKREAVAEEFRRPTASELLTMVNGDPNDIWRSDDIKKRTELATKV